VHEFRLAVDQLDVGIAATGLRVALAAGFRRLLLIVTRVIEVLVVDLPDISGADRLHVPYVAKLALARCIFVAKRLSGFARVARRHAAHLAEILDRVADIPDHRELVFIVDVVVATLVVGIAELLPAAVGLLLVWKAAH
jgi:hypothetical protein